jgi:hypothetical protein
MVRDDLSEVRPEQVARGVRLQEQDLDPRDHRGVPRQARVRRTRRVAPDHP